MMIKVSTEKASDVRAPKEQGKGAADWRGQSRGFVSTEYVVERFMASHPFAWSLTTIGTSVAHGGHSKMYNSVLFM
jgi:hypothetical protein